MSEQQAAVELTADQKIELLGGKLIFALKHANFPGAGLVAYGIHDGGPIRMVHWMQDFCDALDQCGFQIDRDALDKVRNPPRRRKARPRPEARP